MNSAEFDTAARDNMPLRPQFTFDEADSTTLYEGPLFAEIGTTMREFRGRIWFVQRPQPRIYAQLTGRLVMGAIEGTKLSLPGSTGFVYASREGFGIKFGDPDNNSVTVRVNGLFSITAGPMARLYFHVCNFIDYFGEYVRYAEGTSQISSPMRLTLSWDVWEITLDMVTRRKEVYARIFDGGFGITQVGLLQRKDRHSFTAEEAHQQLCNLHWFLCFCRGAKSGPCLLKGYTEDGRFAYEDWALSPADTWEEHYSWFPRVRGFKVQAIYQGFIDALLDPRWEGMLVQAISLYCDANRQGGFAESKIMIVQSILELMAWVILHENASPPEFQEGDPARVKIAKLLDWLGISAACPQDQTSLNAVSVPTDCDSGPGRFTWVRNRIVHPNLRHREQLQAIPAQAIHEACQLGLWYVELVILKLAGYDGLYCNRTKIPTYEEPFEMVPWSTRDLDLWP